jgi:hypothetical protein
MRRWSEIFIALAFVGFVLSIIAVKGDILGFSVKAYGQFTLCALTFSIALSLLEMTRISK